MKVAIDMGPLVSGHAVRGIGVHTQILLNYLRKIKDLEVKAVDFSKTDLSKYDIAHYQSLRPYFWSLPFSKQTKIVLTIHDLIPLIYPEAYPPGVKGKIRYCVQKVLIKKVDAIITISETSKKDIVRFLGISPNKINVIYLAPRRIFKKMKVGSWKMNAVAKRYNLPKKFVLYVGDVNYNKNILNLAEASKIAKLPLVVVGKQVVSDNFDRTNVENEHLVEFLNKYKNDPNILRIGFIPDEDLVAIYNLAIVYCFPSFYEGFSLTILEAMACGTPVVASKIQAHTEIAGNAAFFVDPKDPKEIGSGIKKIIEDESLRKMLIENGLAKANDYSWAKVAKETYTVYEKVFRS
jgi:glycosyltransferase involved in cell wall biosynthesis